MKNSILITATGCALVSLVVLLITPDMPSPYQDGISAPPAGWRILKCHDSETYVYDMPLHRHMRYGDVRFQDDSRYSTKQAAINAAWYQWDFSRHLKYMKKPADACKWEVVL
jgi:hypothetical protein